MPGVHLHQPRTLVIEGALRYKEDTIKVSLKYNAILHVCNHSIFLVQLDAYVFLFTDMLLITKPCKKSPDQLVIVKTVSQ